MNDTHYDDLFNATTGVRVGEYIIIAEKKLSHKKYLIAIPAQTEQYINFAKEFLQLLQAEYLLKHHLDDLTKDVIDKIKLSIIDLHKKLNISAEENRKTTFNMALKRYEKVKKTYLDFDNLGVQAQIDILLDDKKIRSSNSFISFKENIQKILSFRFSELNTQSDYHNYGLSGYLMKIYLHYHRITKNLTYTQTANKLKKLHHSVFIIPYHEEAFIEACVSKVLNIRGVKTRNLTLLDSQELPLVIFPYKPNYISLEGKLGGGKRDDTNFIVAVDEKDFWIKLDLDGNLIYVSGFDAKNNPTDYEKIITQTQEVKLSSESEYQAAIGLADDTISGFGLTLINLISLGNHQAVGKLGENLGIRRQNKGDDNHYQLFANDFTNPFATPNEALKTLSDDFTFINPDKRFLNFKCLYDNTLLEKMKGIYILAALRQALSSHEITAIAAEFASRHDNAFVTLFNETAAKPNADLIFIKDSIDMLKSHVHTAETNDKKDLANYLNKVIANLEKICQQMIKNDKDILSLFAKRVHLLPSEIEVLDNLEKLTSAEITTLSPDKDVLLNHIFIPRESRVTWELKKINDAYQLFTDNAEDGTAFDAIDQHLSSIRAPELQAIFKRRNLVTDTVKHSQMVVIDNITLEEFTKIQTLLTEERVAFERIKLNSNRHHEYLNNDERVRIHHLISHKKHKPKIDNKTKKNQSALTVPFAPDATLVNFFELPIKLKHKPKKLKRH